jgi:hypothetical protein
MNLKTSILFNKGLAENDAVLHDFVQNKNYVRRCSIPVNQAMPSTLVSEHSEDDIKPVESRFSKLNFKGNENSRAVEHSEFLGRLGYQIDQLKNKSLFTRSNSDAFIINNRGYSGNSIITVPGDSASNNTSGKINVVYSPAEYNTITENEFSSGADQTGESAY